MKQALHIFRKDVRYLRLEIAMMLALAAIFAALGTMGWPADVYEVAALYVVARLIHAEAIPGDRQFWLTRPYRPFSLCGAKLLFILVFICIPIGIAQFVMATILGFPMAQQIPGLLWTQVLMFFVGALPVVALAALTESIVPFIITVLILAVITLLGGSALPGMLPAPPLQVAWIGSILFAAGLVWMASVIVVWQYRDRRTLFSCVFGAIVFDILLAAHFLMPTSLLLAAQTWFSEQPQLASAVSIKPDLGKRITGVDSTPGRNPTVLHIPLPLVISGLPDSTEARPDALAVTFLWRDKTWSPALRPGVNDHSAAGGQALFDSLIQMPPALFNERRLAPLIIRGTLYMTLFGEPETRTISVSAQPVNVQDGLQCFVSESFGEIPELFCRSFFRWPSRLVYAQAKDAESDFINTIRSYSPLPANFNLTPLELRWAGPLKTKQVTILTKRPLVHFHRDFELQGIKLADFEKTAETTTPKITVTLLYLFVA